MASTRHDGGTGKDSRYILSRQVLHPKVLHSDRPRLRRATVGRQPVLAFSPVDLQEATSERGTRVAEYYLSISGICVYGSGEIDSARRSCCGLREKTPLKI